MDAYLDHLDLADYCSTADTIDVLSAGREDVSRLLHQAQHAPHGADRVAALRQLHETVLPALAGACAAAQYYEEASR